jgi:hypothetical protein
LWLLLRLLFLPILIELWTQHGDTDTPFYRQDLQNREIQRCQLRFEMSQKRFQINLARSTLHCCIALYCMFECTTYRMYDMVVQAGG